MHDFMLQLRLVLQKTEIIIICLGQRSLTMFPGSWGHSSIPQCFSDHRDHCCLHSQHPLQLPSSISPASPLFLMFLSFRTTTFIATTLPPHHHNHCWFGITCLSVCLKVPQDFTTVIFHYIWRCAPLGSVSSPTLTSFQSKIGTYVHTYVCLCMLCQLLGCNIPCTLYLLDQACESQFSMVMIQLGFLSSMQKMAFTNTKASRKELSTQEVRKYDWIVVNRQTRMKVDLVQA